MRIRNKTGKEDRTMCKKNEEHPESQELELDELEQVTGGGVFDDVPRVPQKPIDEPLRSKI